MLELRGVFKTYLAGTVNETRLFNDLCLTVPKGQFVSVVGSNGSGKTSLLNIICGQTRQDAGSVFLSGRDISREKEFRRYASVGRVYQNPAMGTCGGMTLLENIALADNKGRGYGLTPGTVKARIPHYKDLLAQLHLGLEDKLHIQAAALSGGQRQAMALLMATMTPISFLILDEHTAALDPKTAEVIMKLTDELVRAKQLTTLMVTHNLRHAAAYGDRLVMFDAGKIAWDFQDADKAALKAEDVFRLFTQMSTGYGG